MISSNATQPGFVNFAHRGASEYAPENTMMAFNLGLYMYANGIETDVQLTADGVPVLFHDDTLTRTTGKNGAVKDYTYDQLRQFDVVKGNLTDKILKLEDFLIHFGFRQITFAIELKEKNSAQAVADLIRKYAIADKATVTSFCYDALLAVRAYAPELKTGFLTAVADDALCNQLRNDGITEICPKAEHITPQDVDRWHSYGFNVRAWGAFDDKLMQQAYDAGVDGMTVNAPDRLHRYMQEKPRR